MQTISFVSYAYRELEFLDEQHKPGVQFGSVLLYDITPAQWLARMAASQRIHGELAILYVESISVGLALNLKHSLPTVRAFGPEGERR